MWSAAAALWDELMSINITIYHLGTLMSMLKPDTTKRNIKILSYKVCLKVPLALYFLFSCCHWAWCCFITKMQYTSNIWWSKGFVYLLGVSCPSFKIFVAPKDKNSNTCYFFIPFLQNKHKYKILSNQWIASSHSLYLAFFRYILYFWCLTARLTHI